MNDGPLFVLGKAVGKEGPIGVGIVGPPKWLIIPGGPFEKAGLGFKEGDEPNG